MSTAPRQKVIVCDLSRVDYEQAWRLQTKIHTRLVDAKRAQPAEPIPHVILTVEHPPVFTLGKSGDKSHLLLNRDELARRGATFFEIDRGGDITFHGPGQQVVYPILDLDRFYTDIHRYLRELEEAVIRTCAELGVAGRRIDGRTGVWIGPDDRGPERKVCAMGIRCSRWVTMHGLAMNLNTDLDFFSMIVPCGITDRGVTSIAQELGRDVDLAHVRSRLIHHIADLFAMDVEHLSADASGAFIEDFIGEPRLFTGA